MINSPVKTLISLALMMLLVGCGSVGRKDVPLAIYSDPLGAYALLKVEYSDKRDSDWIFLGPTPIKVSKSIDFEKAKNVTLRVIREDFQEQSKTWSAKDFIKMSKRGDKIFWSPAMVKN